MNFITAGTVAGVLALASALSNAFHYPALGAFFADPATAASATSVLTGALAIAAGVLKGVEAKS